MNVVCLVQDLDDYLTTRRRQAGDVRLEGIRFEYSEWLQILFELFEGEIDFDDETKRLFLDRKRYLTLTVPLEGYPYFSRIRGFIGDAVYDENEVIHLKQECSDLLGKASGELAVSGLRNLVKICNLALRRGKSIVFVGN